MPLHQVDDLEKGRAVSADITNAGWPRMGYANIAQIEAAEAGRRLARLSVECDFVLFEYWKTDKAGHSKTMRDAIESLELFDGMLKGILETLDTTETLLLITSDHGNVEDMSTKGHTRNPVPAILFGCRHREVAQTLQLQPDLTSVAPTLITFMNADERTAVNA